MPAQLVVDAHFHLYRRAHEGEERKAEYEIWEYGSRTEDVIYSERSGDVASALEALDAAECRCAIVLNLHEITTPGVAAEQDLVDFNHWLCDVAVDDPRFFPMIAVDPHKLDVSANVSHLEGMVEKGARGIKIHPPLQSFDPGDISVRPIFARCMDLDLRVVSHCGPSEGNAAGTPDSFRPLLSAFPRLKLVLAHMGGAAYHELPELAKDFPSVYFDCSEIIHWLGAESAPTRVELVRLIREVGVERVMMGSDFPWYDVDKTVALVNDLPGLSTAEKDAVVGENAARFFDLSV